MPEFSSPSTPRVKSYGPVESRGSSPSLRSEIGILFGRQPRHGILRATTVAFFMSFLVWFDMAPFGLAISKQVGLSKAQLAALLLCNLVLAVPGRVIAGKLLDRYGARRLYGGLLIAAVIPNTVFATAHSFAVLAASRLVLGLLGAGFVLGIRLVAEWFDETEIGAAEGFYGGWGNFGSAAAALLLPVVALNLAGGPGAWRWAVFVAGVVAGAYGVALLFLVRDTPEGGRFARPKVKGALEVTSRASVLGLIALQLPLFGIVGVVVWRLNHAHALGNLAAMISYIAIAAVLVHQIVRSVSANGKAWRGEYLPQEQYRFASVALLALGYAVTFGTELTMVSLLPTFFATTFGLKMSAAGVAGSAFAFTNLVTRPGGGLLSDRVSSRRNVVVFMLFGAAVIFALLTQMTKAWPLAAGIGAVAVASVFIQGGNGAIFAIVPLVRREITGQISGIVGAYGNAGALALSSVLFYTATKTSVGNTSLVFGLVAVAALLVGLAARFLPILSGANSGQDLLEMPSLAAEAAV